jgi:hypothetical protein
MFYINLKLIFPLFFCFVFKKSDAMLSLIVFLNADQQCCGSGLLDPDQHWKCGSGDRRAKMTHKSIKSQEISCFELLKCWMFSFESRRLLL